MLLRTVGTETAILENSQYLHDCTLFLKVPLLDQPSRDGGRGGARRNVRPRWPDWGDANVLEGRADKELVFSPNGILHGNGNGDPPVHTAVGTGTGHGPAATRLETAPAGRSPRGGAGDWKAHWRQLGTDLGADGLADLHALNTHNSCLSL